MLVVPRDPSALSSKKRKNKKIIKITEGIDSDAEGALRGEGSGDLSLELGVGSSDEGSVVDESVLGSVVLGSEGSEEGLLGSEDLDGGGGLLGQVDEGTGVGDKSGSNEFADHDGEIGGDGHHSGLEVLGQRLSVLGKGDDLVAEFLDVELVLI